MIDAFLSGAIALASWLIALFFYRFQKSTGDTLFGFFAAAFVLLGFERIGIEFLSGVMQSYVYLIRLGAFLLILFGIWDKNRKERKL